MKKIITDRYEVDEKKFELAYKKVAKLLEEMFGTDSSGDPNVEFTLINRQRCESLPYYPVEYSHYTENSEEMLPALKTTQMNLSMAQSRFNTVFDIFIMTKRKEEEMKEKKSMEKSVNII